LVIFEAKIGGLALVPLSNLYTCQPLLKSIHLFFHDPHLYVQGLVKLHEPIDVSRKSIDTILYARESLVHFVSENAKVKIDDIESPINLHKSAINLLKSPVNLRESTINLLDSPIIPHKPAINLFNSPVILREFTINLLDSPIIPHKPAIDLFNSPVILREFTINLLDSPIIPRKPAIDLLESRIRPLKSGSKKPFNSCKALIDGSNFLCRFLLCHLPYLAALSPDESQVLKSPDHFVRPRYDLGISSLDDCGSQIAICILHSAICHFTPDGSAAPMIRQILAQPLVPCIVDFADRAQLRVRTLDTFHQSDDAEIDAGQVRIGAEVIADHYDAFGFELGEDPLDLFSDKAFSFQRREHFRGEPRFFPTAAQQIHDRLSSLGYVTGSAHSLYVHVTIS